MTSSHHMYYIPFYVEPRQYYLLFPGEKGYDPQFFHYKVERVFIDDHNVPSLEWVTLSAVMYHFCFTSPTHFRLQLHKRAFQPVSMSTISLRDMLKYTASMREWMSADPKNIIAIHCKGGKGGAKDPDLFHYHFAICLSWIKTLIDNATTLSQDAQALWCAPGLLTVTSLRVHRYVSFSFEISSCKGQLIVKTYWNNTTSLHSFLFVHQDSLEYFGERRTDKSRSSKFQGVETPSQVRTSQKRWDFVMF